MSASGRIAATADPGCWQIKVVNNRPRRPFPCRCPLAVRPVFSGPRGLGVLFRSSDNRRPFERKKHGSVVGDCIWGEWAKAANLSPLEEKTLFYRTSTPKCLVFNTDRVFPFEKLYRAFFFQSFFFQSVNSTDYAKTLGFFVENPNYRKRAFQ